jgi:hypothetical protein
MSAGADMVEPTKPAKPPDKNLIKKEVSFGDFPSDK